MTEPREYWEERWGTVDEVIADVLLDAEPGTVVTIVEGDPDDPRRTFLIYVQPWGEA